MKKGKIFYLLRKLDEKEFKKLRGALNSPILNTNKRLTKLYEALRPSYPNFKNSESYRRRIYQKVYPNETYHYGKLHKLFSAFCRVIENYLLWLELEEDQSSRKKLQLQLYQKRNMASYFEDHSNLLHQELAQKNCRDLEYYETQVYLNRATYFNANKDKYDLKDQSLDQLVDSLDHYFLWAKMRYGLSMKSRERILGKPGKWRFQKAIEEESQSGWLKDSILFQLYQQAYLMLDEHPSFSFDNFELQLFTHFNQLEADTKVLFHSGLNYLIRRINQGDPTVNNRVFKWYQFGLDHQIFLEKNQISEITFGNIVLAACRVEKFEWVQYFIDTHQGFLKPEDKKEIVTYHVGLSLFYQKKFNEAFDILLNHNFSSIFFLKSRLIAIWAIFENFLIDIDYYDLLQSQIRAFEAAMYRNHSYSSSNTESAINCITLIKHIAKKVTRQESPSKIKEWLVNKLAKTQNIAAKQWIMEKVEAL